MLLPRFTCDAPRPTHLLFKRYFSSTTRFKITYFNSSKISTVCFAHKAQMQTNNFAHFFAQTWLCIRLQRVISDYTSENFPVRSPRTLSPTDITAWRKCKKFGRIVIVEYASQTHSPGKCMQNTLSFSTKSLTRRLPASKYRIAQLFSLVRAVSCFSLARYSAFFAFSISLATFSTSTPYTLY